MRFANCAVMNSLSSGGLMDTNFFFFFLSLNDLTVSTTGEIDD